MNNLAKIGQQLLYGLITAKELDIPYYIKDNFDLLLMEESDIFITDDEILAQVRKMLSDKYTLQEIPVEREFISEYEDDNFFYGDIELKLIENV